MAGPADRGPGANAMDAAPSSACLMAGCSDVAAAISASRTNTSACWLPLPPPAAPAPAPCPASLLGRGPGAGVVYCSALSTSAADNASSAACGAGEAGRHTRQGHTLLGKWRARGPRCVLRAAAPAQAPLAGLLPACSGVCATWWWGVQQRVLRAPCSLGVKAEDLPPLPLPLPAPAPRSPLPHTHTDTTATQTPFPYPTRTPPPHRT